MPPPSETKSCYGFRWDGASFSKRIRTRVGLVPITILCSEKEREFVRKYSGKVADIAKAWPVDRKTIAKIVQIQMLNFYGKYLTENFKKIVPEDLRIVSISCIGDSTDDEPCMMYTMDLHRQGQKILLGKNQYLELPVGCDSETEVRLFCI